MLFIRVGIKSCNAVVNLTDITLQWADRGEKAAF